jgi:hypothetical protein
MEQQEYDELMRRMDTRIALLETFQEQQQRLMDKMDTRQDDLQARQQVHEDIMKSLAATLVKQDTINDRLTTAIEHVSTAIERLDVTLQAIKDMLPRGNGRTEG